MSDIWKSFCRAQRCTGLLFSKPHSDGALSAFSQTPRQQPAHGISLTYSRAVTLLKTSEEAVQLTQRSDVAGEAGDEFGDGDPDEVADACTGHSSATDEEKAEGRSKAHSESEKFVNRGEVACLPHTCMRQPMRAGVSLTVIILP